ncbi:MAG: S-adenosylmethionine decarboxylase proenzyme [Candidatus Buchananbacteria bacterium RIFCSPHIGHO2_01_FULL_39_14]|uniref:S-adenosylmethionine decarboxylase proenzyme n=2 Tax=Candidatus Buchananiibacteriota TaxID=1817903 RepID=A0A1G1YMC0_9BACT|nr:MAG: S-adenosylmethionine decarboxylase proenzyme [Candidatus Buchananbacteria bacterium RIFCSPHIGHO2_01_FULL_39_14]OGY48733.1 MAG: S-adenosylmethionine decarboxylase proenzyme [Candidatus Buchananbacteria bacterium RIFCSPHIGHO2_02_FULL_39_17]OGY53505.1 MAG: S-adenosylmethionine decarboxylase proenzyme [Candidatus Buchananbacteria bacterium RIFCSPLOWO2_01_FULL_40_23b]
MKPSDNYFGPHLMLEGYGCDRKKLLDMRRVFKFLNNLPNLIGMHKISTPYVIDYDGGEKPKDWGFSGMVLIAESHISIHTFPEKNFVSIDVYSCKIFSKEKVVKIFKQYFSPKSVEINLVIRGKKFEKT